jgi:hypothetical protein
MGRNVGGKGNVDTTPGLAFFLPGVYLAKGEPFSKKEKRGRKVVPNGISSEIKGVQVVPIEFMAKATERLFGILSHGQSLASLGLDANRVAKKHALFLPPGKRMEKNIGCCCRYPCFVGLKYSKSKTEG